MRRALALALIWGGAGGCAHRTSSEVRAQEVLAGAQAARVDLQVSCSPPDAEVSVDAVPRGLCSDYDAPGAGLRLGAGMHQVAIRKEGFRPYVTYYEPSGARLSLSIELVPAQGGGKKP